MPSAIVFGGCGALGQVVVQKLNEAGWTTISIDLRSSSTANHSIEIKGGGKDDAHLIFNKLKEFSLRGFVMAGPKDESVFETVDKMWSFNVQSAVLASHVACNVLQDNGLLVLTGANGALNPWAGALGYGISKAATHHIVASLATEGSGLPTGATVACLVPIMLDTPMNRRDMPDANFDDWTPLEHVAQLLADWTTSTNRPKNGAMVQLKTKAKKTEFINLN